MYVVDASIFFMDDDVAAMAEIGGVEVFPNLEEDDFLLFEFVLEDDEEASLLLLLLF